MKEGITIVFIANLTACASAGVALWAGNSAGASGAMLTAVAVGLAGAMFYVSSGLQVRRRNELSAVRTAFLLFGGNHETHGQGLCVMGGGGTSCVSSATQRLRCPLRLLSAEFCCMGLRGGSSLATALLFFEAQACHSFR